MASQISHPLERKFRTTNAYKRSKNYLDIRRINRIQHKQQLERRKPKTQTNLQSVDLKFEESFISADVKLQYRVRTQINKQKLRCFRQDDEDEIDTTHSNTAGQEFRQLSKKNKTLDMNKMLSREFFQKQTQFSRDEAQFCNFKDYQPPKNHTIDFQKFLTVRPVKKYSITRKCLKCTKKQKKLIQNNIKDSVYSDQLGRIYQKLTFDESAFRTFVDFKNNNKETAIKIVPQLEKDQQRIRLGQRLTKKTFNHGLCQFFHGKNKWSANQMDNRLSKQNQFFLAHYNKKNEKLLDWSIIKRKVDLVQKKRMEVMQRKNIKDIKGQICDELYFRRNH